MAETPEKKTVPTTPAGAIISNLTAPTIFFDGAVGMSVTNGVAKINLYQNVQDFQPDGTAAEMKRVIVARLAMSPATLVLLMEWLQKNVKVEQITAGAARHGAPE